MSSLDVLKDLQDRVTQLERQAGDTPGADNLQPNLITVDPTGKIGASFTGLVNALGLIIPAGVGGNPPSTNRIIWRRGSDGAVMADIWGSENGTDGSLQLTTYQRSGDSGAVAVVTAQGSNVSDAAFLQAKTGAGGNQNSVAVLASDSTHNNSATILDALGASSFLQLLSTQQLQLAYGSGTFAGNNTPEVSFTVTHNLGRVPVLALAFPVNFTGMMQRTGKTSTQATFTATITNVPANAGAVVGVSSGASNWSYDWLAIG